MQHQWLVDTSVTHELNQRFVGNFITTLVSCDVNSCVKFFMLAKNVDKRKDNAIVDNSKGYLMKNADLFEVYFF